MPRNGPAPDGPKPAASPAPPPPRNRGLIGQTGHCACNPATGPVGRVGARPTGAIGSDSGSPPTGLLFLLVALALALGVAMALFGAH